MAYTQRREVRARKAAKRALSAFTGVQDALRKTNEELALLEAEAIEEQDLHLKRVEQLGDTIDYAEDQQYRNDRIIAKLEDLLG